jgi:cell wall assembly regulator SMI1
VSAQPPILTEALLDELEARWRAQSAPIVGQLRSGIDDATMAELAAPLGLTVPAEVRTWYRWHNGATETEWRKDVEMCGMGWRFFSLERATKEAVRRRAMALKACNQDQEEADQSFWRWAWLPLADNQHGGVMFVDGRASSDPPRTQVIYTEPEIGTDTPPAAPSLGQVVTWWIEAIDTGLYAYDSARDRWYFDVDARDQVDQRADQAAGRRFLV